MIIKIDLSTFRNEFERYGRENKFSYDGLEALFEHLTYENEVQELDVLSICCDYSEYANIEEYMQVYEYDVELTIEELENEKTIIKIDNSNGFIISY